MNQSPTSNLLKSVDSLLMNNSNQKQSAGPARKRTQKQKKSGPKSGNRSQNGSMRSLKRDPGVRGDNALSLTRSQFTATSPLSLFVVKAGSSPGGIRVSGRELINSVNIPIASGVWIASTSFPGTLTASSIINPTTFPRLTSYATIYEYFRFHKLKLLFQSNQPTTQTGAIILSVDYDPTDAVPTSTVLQMRNISSTMANLYSDASLEVLQSLSRLPRYKCAVTATEAQQYSQGQLTVAVEGYTNPATSSVGYIIAEYDVEFFTPQ